MKGDPVNIQDMYQELVVQFGYISLFSSVFPLAATLSFISNRFLLFS